MRSRTALYLDRVVTGRSSGTLAGALRIVLLPFSWLYVLGLRVFLWLYRSGLRKRDRLGVPVVSVGNLTFGGTGKTPAVHKIAQMLSEAGFRVGVLSRGHGGSSRAPIVVSDGCDLLVDPRLCGDEPTQLARQLTGIPVVVGRDRRVTGQMAVERFDCDVLLLDDGMQFWQLERDVEICVVDWRRPFGSGLVMPAGDLREPTSGLARADVILLTGCERTVSSKIAAVIQQIARIAPQAAVFQCRREPVGFVPAKGGSLLGLEWIKRKPVAAFCGIGSPNSFMESLDDLGARLPKTLVFPDHCQYGPADAKLVADLARSCEAEATITTEKDLARLGDMADMIPSLYALRISLEVERQDFFFGHIRSGIERAISQIASGQARPQANR